MVAAKAGYGIRRAARTQRYTGQVVICDIQRNEFSIRHLRRGTADVQRCTAHHTGERGGISRRRRVGRQALLVLGARGALLLRVGAHADVQRVDDVLYGGRDTTHRVIAIFGAGHITRNGIGYKIRTIAVIESNHDSTPDGRARTAQRSIRVVILGTIGIDVALLHFVARIRYRFGVAGLDRNGVGIVRFFLRLRLRLRGRGLLRAYKAQCRKRHEHKHGENDGCLHCNCSFVFHNYTSVKL